MKRHQHNWLAAALALVLVACGGAGGDTQVAGIQGSGILGADIAIGRITGFGSIFVNGVEYQTSGATFRIDDNPGAESDLRVGQVVVVRGRVNADGRTGTATEVNFDEDVQGPVANLNIPAGTFSVLGQVVRVSGTTLFDNRLVPASIDGLGAANLVVEVSGFRNAANEIVASRIEPKAAGAELEVKGAVEALDATARTFRIGTLVVDYSAVTPEGSLANAAIVEVKGTSLNTNGSLRATKVEVQSRVGAANDRGEIEGLVTRYVSNADFDVNGQRVSTDGTTTFQLGGVTLAVNVKVEVEGTFNASGVLVARKVELRQENDARVAGLVESVSTSSGNQLRVAGVTATVAATAEYEDKSATRLRQLRFTDLRTGDYVELRGTEVSTGGLTVSQLERLDPQNRTFVQGVARNVAQPSLVVLGVTVTTGAGTQFRDAADLPITAAQFFAAAPSRLVKIRGSLVSGSFVADQAELEN